MRHVGGKRGVGQLWLLETLDDGLLMLLVLDSLSLLCRPVNCLADIGSTPQMAVDQVSGQVFFAFDTPQVLVLSHALEVKHGLALRTLIHGLCV